jgi:hypothetical protein
MINWLHCFYACSKVEIARKKGIEKKSCSPHCSQEAEKEHSCASGFSFSSIQAPSLWYCATQGYIQSSSSPQLILSGNTLTDIPGSGFY